MACVILALCLCGLNVARMRAERAARTIEDAPTRIVRVLPGDSLWSIARDLDWSDSAAGDVVRWIRMRNGLPTSCVYAGDELVVPVCTTAFGA